MRHTVRNTFFIVLLCLISANATADDNDLLIITMNSDIPILSERKAKMIFLGKSKKIGGVTHLKLGNWPENSNVREDFYRTLLKKSVAQVNSQWARVAFSGTNSPPETIDNASLLSLQNWLNNNPQGISYCIARDLPKGAKVLLRIKK